MASTSGRGDPGGGGGVAWQGGRHRADSRLMAQQFLSQVHAILATSDDDPYLLDGKEFYRSALASSCPLLPLPLPCRPRRRLQASSAPATGR